MIRCHLKIRWNMQSTCKKTNIFLSVYLNLLVEVTTQIHLWTFFFLHIFQLWVAYLTPNFKLHCGFQAINLTRFVLVSARIKKKNNRECHVAFGNWKTAVSCQNRKCWTFSFDLSISFPSVTLLLINYDERKK